MKDISSETSNRYEYKENKTTILSPSDVAIGSME